MDNPARPPPTMATLRRGAPCGELKENGCDILVERPSLGQAGQSLALSQRQRPHCCLQARDGGAPRDTGSEAGHL